MIQLLVRSHIGRFRILAFLEGCSYLLLGITMLLKYKYNMPQPNYIVGMAHGFLFMAYCVYLPLIAVKYKLNFVRVLAVFIAALVPVGTFIADHQLLRKIKEK